MQIFDECKQKLTDIKNNPFKYEDDELYDKVLFCYNSLSSTLTLNNMNDTYSLWGDTLVYNRSFLMAHANEIKLKIDLYLRELETASQNKSSLVINNTNTISIDVTFNQSIEKVNSSVLYDEDEKQEITDKINELKAIVEAKDAKVKKWDKAKNIMKYLIDKGIDAGIALLPFLTNFK